jgi:hypothetical protein
MKKAPFLELFISNFKKIFLANANMPFHSLLKTYKTVKICSKNLFSLERYLKK